MDDNTADKPMPVPDPEIMAGWHMAIKKAFPESLKVGDYDHNDWRATKSKIVGIIDTLQKLAEVSLEPNGRKYLSERDALDLQYTGLGQIGSSFNEIERCFIDPLKDTKPALAAHAYVQLWRLVGAAFIIGSRGTISEATAKRTKSLTTERANRAKETHAAKIEEIIREVMGSRIDEPYSINDTQKYRIDEKLKSAGLLPKSKRAIGEVRKRMKARSGAA